MLRLVRLFTVCHFSLGISKSHSRMYLKWTSQKLTSFANSLSLSVSLSLSLSLESSFFLPSCKYDWSPFELEVVCTDFIGKMASHRRESNTIRSPHHETHVFAMVIRSFHCFKNGSYKFLAEGGSVYWLTAYCISIYNLQARFIKNAVPNPISHGPRLVKAIAVNSLLIVSCS